MSGLIVLFVVPALWSFVLGVGRLVTPLTERPRDHVEKFWLGLFLCPILLGAVALGAARWLPAPLHASPASNVSIVATALGIEAFLPAPVPLGPNSGHALLMALAAVYSAITAVLMARLIVTYCKLRLVLQTSRGLEGWTNVRTTAANLPPLAWGRRTVLIPESLVRALEPDVLTLIIGHERTHLRRHDPYWFALLSVVDALFWFNPFVRRQTRLCRLAAELECDAAVTHSEPAMRKAYAESLVTALKHAAGSVRTYAPAAFSTAISGDYSMRIREIMHPTPRAGKSRRWVYAALACLVVPLAATQFAWSGTGAAPTMTTPEDTTPTATVPIATHLADFSIFPLDAPVSSGYGMRQDPITGEQRFHRGVDFMAALGTPIRASAGGTVSAVYDDPNYGKVVEIDDGGGYMTRYAHLDTQAVVKGQVVEAGQNIGTVGNGGQSTGPHLHFEIWRDKSLVNPLDVLTQAGAHAVTSGA